MVVFSQQSFLEIPAGRNPMHWITASLVGMVGIVPAVNLTGIAAKHFGIRPDVTAIFWFASASLGMIIWVVLNGRGAELITFNKMGLWVIGLGFTLGAVANIAIFIAFATAPNPGLPMGIVNANAVLAFLIAALLAGRLPQYFEAGEFSPVRLVGIILTIIGIALISWEK